MRHTPPDPGAALEQQASIDAPTDEQTADEQPQASESDLMALARDAYASSNTYFDANVRRDIEADLRQWQGKHAAGSRYLHPGYANRSKLFVPKTRGAVTRMEAQAAEAFFSSIDVVSIEPYDKEDAFQIEAAGFYSALVEKRLHEPAKKGGIPWFLTLIGAYQDAMVTGVTIGKVWWEYDRNRALNRPRIDLVPVENFRFDPGADWRDPVATSPYLILEIPMYAKDVKARMKAGRWRPYEDAQLSTGMRRYSDTVRMQREGNRQDSKDVSEGHGDYRIVWVREVVLDVDGQDTLFHTLGDSLMLSVSPEPITVQYAPGRPYVVGFTTVEAHRHYPSSIPRLTADLQREANDLRNQRIDNVSFALNRRFFVKRNVQVDIASLTRNVPGAATLMNDPEKDVKAIDTPDVTSSAYAEQDRLNVDFDDLTGQLNNASVQSNRSLNETVGGLQLLDTNANQIAGYRLRTFVETWVEPVLRLLLDLEREYEDDDGYIDMAMRQSGVRTPDPAIWSEEVRLQVNVGMGATNPHQKANLLIFALNSIKTLVADGEMERRGMDVAEVVKEIFAMIGYRDGTRFFAWADDDPRVHMLQSEVERLQQALSAKQPPELTAAQVQKVHAEAVSTMVTAFYSALQAGQAVAAMPSIAGIADQVLAASGYTQQDGDDPNIPTAATPVAPAIGPGTSPALPAPPMAPESPADGAALGIETIEGDATLP